MQDKKLKLFVWEGFAPDYTDGLAFAIAETLEEAVEMVISNRGYNPSDWGKLTIHSLDKKLAKSVAGGG